jgi:SAM-dependent methyltransferase
MATYLRETIPDEALKVIFSLFEEAALDAGSFDLGISATAFHWLDEATALTKIAELLRPGGWWAMDWNVFGDDNRPGADVRRAIPPSLASVQTTVLAPVRDYASLGSSAVGGPRRRVTPFFPVTLFFATALGFPA